MKNILILFILVTTIRIGNAQNLNNTEWFGTHPPNINLYFSFGTDTLFYSTNGNAFTSLSLYTASGGLLDIFDLPGASLCSDTGHYSYAINGSNLTLTLISDNCASRRNTLTLYTWTRTNVTDIPVIPNRPAIDVFPNPADEGVFNLAVNEVESGKSELTLYDAAGKEVYREAIRTATTHVNINFLRQGLYVGCYHSESGNRSFLIIR